jgi:FkbM family methyltransferase
MTLITYAQMMEDIILYRALRDVSAEQGFYIDIGGYHPMFDSVTKLFYDLGWRGVNVEPSAKQFPPFVADRPRDINLQVAVSDHEGEATFYELDQTSTLETRFVDTKSELFTGEYRVQVVTLDRIFEQYAPPEVHFLKIDVEGHEAAVIRGWDSNRFRPWILAIEAFEPNNLDRPTHHEWEHMVQANGYTLAFADRLNRYYVALERRYLLQFFGIPADDFHKCWDIWRTVEVERQREEYKAKLAEANSRLVKLGLEPVT